MKIYFTASIVGRSQFKSHYEAIVNYLSKRHSIVANHILKADHNKIINEKREDRLTFHKNLERWICSADCVIAEVSFPSISVGFEISLALSMGKPVLLLYSEGDPPSLLIHHRDEKLICEQYTLDQLKGVLDDFILYVKGINDVRFTFFITSEIGNYLNRIAKERKIPKSVYLRNLIEIDMQKNR